jgi:hypothetical protein
VARVQAQRDPGSCAAASSHPASTAWETPGPGHPTGAGRRAKGNRQFTLYRLVRRRARGHAVRAAPPHGPPSQRHTTTAWPPPDSYPRVAAMSSAPVHKKEKVLLRCVGSLLVWSLGLDHAPGARWRLYHFVVAVSAVCAPWGRRGLERPVRLALALLIVTLKKPQSSLLFTVCMVTRDNSY